MVSTESVIICPGRFHELKIKIFILDYDKHEKLSENFFHLSFPTLKRMLKKDIYKPDTFLYFAYGANMLGFRIKWFSPSATFVTIARLDVSTFN